MRLLVTRPQPDASETARRLVALGHAVEVAPMMEIAFSPEPAGLGAPAALIVTSRNAVRALEDWPSARAWRGLPVYAVGETTAGLAREAGFRDVRVGAGDVAALADLVRADFDTHAGAILYPAARERAADAAAMLAGYTVDTVKAYHAVAATRLEETTADAIRAAAIEGALFYSRRTAAIFAELVEAAGIGAGLEKTILFALSATVAAALQRLGAKETRVAARPDEESLFALIPPPG
jgi:uroporphyrinogen-III synthase